MPYRATLPVRSKRGAVQWYPQAIGKSADAAYVAAGYRANRSNAARLSANQDIQKRVIEIQSLGAELAAITVETRIAEAEAARSKAMGEKGGAAAAIAAITAKAKLAGLWREKVAQTDPSGENAPRYIISDRPLTEEEWVRERCGGVTPSSRLRGVISCVHLRSLQRPLNWHRSTMRAARGGPGLTWCL
jgi:hypothetical protein